MTGAKTSTTLGRPEHRGGRLRRAAAATLVSRGIGIVTAFILTPIVINGVGGEVYGAYATITSLVGIAVVTDLGIGAGLVARLSQAFGRDDEREAKRLVSSALVALSGLGLVLAAVLAVAALVLPLPSLLGIPSLSAGEATATVLAFGIALGLGLPFGLGDRVLAATQRGAQAAVWSLVASSLTLGATAIAAMHFQSLFAIVVAASFTPRLVGAVQTLVTVTWVTPALRPQLSLVTRGSFGRLQTAGTLFMVQGLAIAVAFESDMLIVSSVLGADQAAVYSVNMRVVSLVGSIAVLTLGQVFPAFGEALSRGDMQWVRRMMHRLTWGLAGYALLLALVLLLLTPAFVTWWVGAEFRPPTALLVGLVVWTAYTTVLIPANMLMNAALVIRTQVLLATAMALLNLPLSIYLTHEIGVAGPIWGSILAHASVSVVPTIVIVRRILRGEYSDARVSAAS